MKFGIIELDEKIAMYKRQLTRSVCFLHCFIDVEYSEMPWSLFICGTFEFSFFARDSVY